MFAQSGAGKRIGQQVIKPCGSVMLGVRLARAVTATIAGLPGGTRESPQVRKKTGEAASPGTGRRHGVEQPGLEPD
jgi:hypothetical protein